MLVIPILLIFLTTGLVITYLSSNLRKRTEEAIKEVATRKQAEAELISYKEHLEDLVKQRTAELNKTNRDLKQEMAEHKKDELELRVSEERLKRAQELAHLGSWELDLVNDRLSWSDEVYRIFGFSRRNSVLPMKPFLMQSTLTTARRWIRPIPAR